MTIPITLIEKGFPMFDIIKDPSFAARGIPFGACLLYTSDAADE